LKVIVKHRPEYNTPIRVFDAEDEDEARDTADEAEQGFGQALILTDQEYLELFRCTPKNCRHGH